MCNNCHSRRSSRKQIVSCNTAVQMMDLANFFITGFCWFFLAQKWAPPPPRSYSCSAPSLFFKKKTTKKTPSHIVYVISTESKESHFSRRGLIFTGIFWSLKIIEPHMLVLSRYFRNRLFILKKQNVYYCFIENLSHIWACKICFWLASSSRWLIHTAGFNLIKADFITLMEKVSWDTMTPI